MLRLIRFLTIAVAVSTVVGILALRALDTPGGKAAATSVLGSCSFEQIRDGQRITGQFPQMRQTMLEGSHMVREDGKYQLWSTPRGEFWYGGPLTTRDAFVLAEEEFDEPSTDERLEDDPLKFESPAPPPPWKRLMKPAPAKTLTKTDDPTVAHLGSEYTDARSYLKQVPRAPRVKTSDETFHGSNDSDFGTAAPE